MPRKSAPAIPETIAAVDLGSNSFHMVVARTTEGHFQVVDRMREMVRLAAGLDKKNSLEKAAVDRAIDCLARFGERVAKLPPAAVRVVGTNTLRMARNSGDFIQQAESALGHSIDVISGQEEARIIYLGVSHGLDDDATQRLVVDIGGGSTEFILGRRFEPLVMESLRMGSVSQSVQFFPDGEITAKRMQAAEIAAQQQLASIESRYARLGWQSAIGASGTIISIRDVVTAEGWSDEGISADSLDILRDKLVKAGHVDKLKLKGLSDDRRPIFPGGVSVLRAAFERLGIERMRVSDSALREGLLYDLIGRIHQEDVRERSVADLAKRYELDSLHAARVAKTAESIREQVAKAWELESHDMRRLLRWAAQLHEIGLAISHSGHHKHGGYLLTHLNLPGFARGEQRRLAMLVRGHRRKFPLAEFENLPSATMDGLLRACVILRLAVIWHRHRSQEALPNVLVAAEDRSIKLRYPDGWLDGHPLIRADLAQEAVYIRAAELKLKFK